MNIVDWIEYLWQFICAWIEMIVSSLLGPASYNFDSPSSYPFAN